jgi:chromosome segregation ATPase
MAAEKAAAEGKAAQLAEDLASAKVDAGRERGAAEQARTELAKALLRLEAMPRLEADLAAARAELTQERAGRVSAEQQSAVLAAQKSDLEGRLIDARKEADRAKEQLQSAQARAEQLLETLADSRVSVQAGQSRIAELVAEGERQAGTILDLAKKLEALSAEKAAAEGKAGQLAEDLASAKVDAGREREAAEQARTELAKALQRLEDKPGRTGKTPPKD